MTSPSGMPPRGVALLERTEVLDPVPESAGEARRLLRDALRGVAREQWVDVGELAISEVVTNASLHAHTPIEVRLGVYPDEVCIEVRDFNPAAPLQRSYDEEATTGRGMGLVAALTRSCGVRSLGDDGKVVWFCVGDTEVHELDDPLSAWDVDGWDEPEPPAVPTCEVTFQAMPATLWLSARQHHDAILRELVLYLAEHPGIEADVASADRARGTISNAVVTALGGAAEPGPLPWTPAQLDLRVTVPADAAPWFRALQDVLDLAEALAVDGQLFVRPGLPEIVAVRDWTCTQVIAQLAGGPPAPWAGTDQARFEVAVHDRADPRAAEWDVASVVEASRGVIAADEANRVIAVSRSLADLLGWEIDELVGRRVVTIVPPALREAHVAGFSRHLSTGEAHVMGTPIEVPVLRRDGTALACRLLIERAPASSGRTVYLAWIDALDR